VTKDEALAALEELAQTEDFEVAHVGADEILCKFLSEIGHADIVEAWDKIGKWYA